MKILQVLNSGRIGGMEQHVIDLTTELVKKGHVVYVWCNEGSIVDQYKNAGAIVVINKIRFDIDILYINKLKNFIKTEKIDVVHGHELKAAVNTLIAAKLAGVNARVSHTHTPISEWKVGGIKKFFTVRFYAFIVNMLASKEIALTPSRKEVKIKEGIKPEKIAVIPNGIDLQKFSISPVLKNTYREEIRARYNIPVNAFVFGNLGRISAEKGHDTLIKAFASFIKNELFHERAFYLLVAGGGACEDDVRRNAQALGISDRVIVTGVFEAEDLIKFYCAFDGFIFASAAEGFGYVLIESMYFGIPTVASDLTVLKEVGADTVLYFRSGDYKHLAEKMVELYSLVTTGGEEKVYMAKSRVDQLYSLEIFVDSYIKLYEDINIR